MIRTRTECAERLSQDRTIPLSTPERADQYHRDPIVRDLEIMAKATNYRNWILSHYFGFIGKRVLEIGAGIGNYTEVLTDREVVIAIDNHEPCVDYLRDRFKGHKNIAPLKMDISSSLSLTLREYELDTAICLNVLEHIYDDIEALRTIRAILSKYGKIILLVPAFQFLYGSIDRLVGHHRRYTKNEINKKLNSAGFEVNDIFYMNSIAVLAWFVNNRILNIKEESFGQVLLYDRRVVPVLRKIEEIMRPPFGLSVVAIASKNMR